MTGSFELHHVPPGTYDLVLVTPNLSDVLPGVQVVSGQTNDLATRNICFAGLIPSRSSAGVQPAGCTPAIAA